MQEERLIGTCRSLSIAAGKVHQVLAVVFWISICRDLRFASSKRKVLRNVDTNPEVNSIGPRVAPFDDKGHAVLKLGVLINGCESVTRSHSCLPYRVSRRSPDVNQEVVVCRVEGEKREDKKQGDVGEGASKDANE